MLTAEEKDLYQLLQEVFASREIDLGVTPVFTTDSEQWQTLKLNSLTNITTTTSLAGRFALRLLLQPLAPSGWPTLQRRMQLITSLRMSKTVQPNKRRFILSLHKLLQELREHEPYLLAFFDERDPLLLRMKGFRTLPGKWSSEAEARLVQARALFMTAALPLRYMFNIWFAINIGQNIYKLYDKDKSTGFMKDVLKIVDGPSSLDPQHSLKTTPGTNSYIQLPGYDQLSQGEIATQTSTDHIYKSNGHKFIKYGVGYPFMLGDLILKFVSMAEAPVDVYSSYATTAMLGAVISSMHDILFHVAQAVAAIRQIDELLQEHLPYLAQHEAAALHKLSTTISNVRSLIQAERTGAIGLLANLSDPIFAQKSLSSLQLHLQAATIIKTYLAMHAHKNLLVPAWQALGFVDAYASIARLLDKPPAPHAIYCVPELFKTSTAPLLEFSDVWTPLVSAEKAVTNDLHLGTALNRKHNALLSGPHSCGKSTIMKAIGHAVVLAQSLGICPAKTARLSLFSSIQTYMNVTEDLAHARSSFVAERERMQGIEMAVEHLPKDQFALVLIDEPYAKTIPEVAEKRVISFTSSLDKHPNTMLILATHLLNATRILIARPEWLTLHPEVIRVSPRNFKLTYHIKPGPAEWWLSNENLREEFIDWLDTIFMESK
jgi:hypothetical protein